ncbi:MAG: hypothetical protein OQK69_03775, partial [Gammaproteobacteria bacterium]|nr:hypothetical protein [Gammaproteobacteria bacterium]
QFSSCYQQAEKQAFCKNQGVWSDKIQAVADLDNLASGFHVLRGKLKNIKASSKGIWLRLEHGLSLRIAFKHKPLFDMSQLNTLINRDVIIRGWLQAKRQPKPGERFYMQIKHPAAIEEAKKALKC